MTIGELLKAIGGPNNECDPDTPVMLVVSKPGTVGGTPTIPIKSAGYGFDWNNGKFLLHTDPPLIVETGGRQKEALNAKSGDILKSKGRDVQFQVTEVVDGHCWGNVITSKVPGECCWICGLMRRRDKQNKPCKGPVRIELR